MKISWRGVLKSLLPPTTPPPDPTAKNTSVCIISWVKSFNSMPYAFFGFFIKCACPLLISKTTKNAKIKLIFLHNYVKWYTTGARWFQDILKLCTLGIQDGQYNIPVDTQNVNWTYIRSSEDILDVFWTSYVRSMYVLCLRGFLSKVRFDFIGPNCHFNFYYSGNHNIFTRETEHDY